MKVVVQRVINAQLEIDNKLYSKINNGLVLLVGFTDGDNQNIINKMIDKILNLRIFEDDNHLMNLSLLDIKASILSVSQFTLYADCSAGRRPSFVHALAFDEANNLYNYFNVELEKRNIYVQTGVFGADMKVSLINDGPCTIILDSQEVIKDEKK